MNDVAALSASLRAATEQLTAPGAPFELAQKNVNGVAMRCYANAPANLREALDAGRAHGDKVAVTYQDERYTFTEFFAAADRFSNYLMHEAGIRKGDRVAIAMRNYPEWMFAFVGTLAVGAVVVPVNSWGRAEELAYALTDAGARVVVCDPERHTLLREHLATLDCTAIVVHSAGANIAPAIAWETTQAADAQRPDVSLDAQDLGMIMYTSGTTGKPKGAASTHAAICQALMNFELMSYVSAMTNPEVIGKMMGSGFEPCTLLAVPLFHVSGCYAIFLLNLRGGRKTSILYKWDPEDALRVIERERITVFTGVPAMTIAMLESPAFDSTDTRSLFSLGAGGAACPPHLKDLIYSKVPDAYPGTGYGMTETNATGSSCTGEAYRLRPTAAGTLSPIVDMQSVDPEGAVLPVGQPGELMLRSPTNAREYWNLPNATAETFVEGWVRTGDIGFVDDDGFVHVVDRIKDMVIRNGENIYPVEVEGILTAHPKVREASVYGLPHPDLGEEVAATVHGSAGLQAEELVAYLKEHMAGYKVPTQWQIGQEPLVRNATGKLLKPEIRKAHLAHWQHR
ncbi:MAG: acyl--CoA ligase [Haliea sp.]|nr:acyl--CoA ligase [Haliea sp.]